MLRRSSVAVAAVLAGACARAPVSASRGGLGQDGHAAAAPVTSCPAGDAGSADATAVSTAADSGAPAPNVERSLVKVPRGPVALVHVRLFDGTLGGARADQAMAIDNGEIVSVGPASTFVARAGMTVLDLAGRSVMPGIVGMHNHLYYIASTGRWDRTPPPALLLPELFESAPRLYLAGGVTTMRTTGSVEPFADLSLRRMIEQGTALGPDLDVTAPYLEGPGGYFPQMPAVKTAAEARRFVAYWADAGATSFKAYTHLSRDVLKAAIDEAHRRHLKVTGHLCSITYAEAAAMGIDDLEHGFFASTDLVVGKRSDVCPESGKHAVLMSDTSSAPVRDLITLLVARHVALTSTLPVYEQNLPGRAQDPRASELLVKQYRERYGAVRAMIDAEPDPAYAKLWKNELDLERAFVAAGGLLLAGPDPTGNGGVLPGFGDQRGIELLVEAGFTAVEAIHIATSNGAEYLGRLSTIGTVAVGKKADLVVMRGDPEARIRDVENVEIVFKKGVGYDPQALIDSVRGTVGLY